MTSEVLILNKRAMVLGADSAVTTSGGDHPRYSKSANKIFEISRNGNVAAMIFGAAAVDLLPWEVALKEFRTHLGNTSFPSLDDYGKALFEYLSGNNKLFDSDLRKGWVNSQFDEAVKVALKEVDTEIFNKEIPLQVRSELWISEVGRLNGMIEERGVLESLSENNLNEFLSEVAIGPWIVRVADQLREAQIDAVDAGTLAILGHKIRYSYPHLILFGGTGLVIAGYGDDQIFPAYSQYEVYGHIADELAYKRIKNFEVSHTSSAMIQPLAQSSMISMFTEGFSGPLEKIIQEQGESTFQTIFEKLKERGIEISGVVTQAVIEECKTSFMQGWKLKNWEQNFHPLLNVLQSLSIQEMAHLAESLLGLESLKERVTSPSESIGGPIDVVAITKSEGLVWIRRKHYFDPSLNMRYAARLERSFN